MQYFDVAGFSGPHRRARCGKRQTKNGGEIAPAVLTRPKGPNLHRDVDTFGSPKGEGGPLRAG
jgi:hypothetical protein